MENQNTLLPATKTSVGDNHEVGLLMKKSAHPYHLRFKRDIPEELINKAFANNIFPGLNLIEPQSEILSLENFSILEDAFLQREFFSLQEIGVSLSDPMNQPSKLAVDNTGKLYMEKGMTGQATVLLSEYKSLCAITDIFSFTKEVMRKEKFDHTHISLLQSVDEVCRSLSTEEKSFVLESMAHVCTWNAQRGKHRTPVALSYKYIPELFMSSPVWFISGNDVANNESASDPQPTNTVKFFCDTVGTKEFAWMFQMYNRRTRTFKDFKSSEIMPPHLTEILPELKQKFDYLVIATPYHDLASKEWANPAWQRSLDPYLLGFKIGVPYVVLIDRWSGTGLFPLVANMIADTVNHIKVNMNLLNNFNANAYWYRGDIQNCLGASLTTFATEMVHHFEQGKLFEVLRGNKS